MFLRRFAGSHLASANKGSTGVVGVDVVPNAREVLISLYQQTLQAVQPIPESAQYRKSVEALAQHRLKVVIFNPACANCTQVVDGVENSSSQQT